MTNLIYKIVNNLLFLLSFRRPAITAARIKPEKVLLVLPMKGIGDILLVKPLVEGMREQWEHAEIEAVVRDRKLLELASHLLPVDRFHVWGYDWMKEPGQGLRIAGQLRRQSFDMVLDLMCDHSAASALFSFLIGAPLTAGFSCPRRKAFFNSSVAPDWSSSHIVDDWHALAESIGVRYLSRCPSLKLDHDELGFAKSFFEKKGVISGLPIIVIHPGARDDLSTVDKRWHWTGYRDLCRILRERMGVQVVLLGSGEEKELSERIAEGAGEGLVDICGAAGILETLSLIGVSDLFIGNNSGPLHLACALEVPTISFSGGINLVRWGPCGNPETNRVMMPDPGCSAVQCAGCEKKGKICLGGVDVEAVAAVALDMLQKSEGSHLGRLFPSGP